jgi:hypothetical protein
MNWLKKLYSEDQGPSDCEVILFYLSIIFSFLFLILVESGGFTRRHLTLLFPAVFWILLRSSRKDMKASSIMIAGSIGAIVGALIAIVTNH